MNKLLILFESMDILGFLFNKWIILFNLFNKIGF